MQQLLSGEGRDIPVLAFVVWVEMLPADARADIAKVAATMKDARVRSFHDPQARAGQAIAAGLGAVGKRAWDIYLFYDSEAEWGERPPAPRGWAHQLSDPWADPARLRRRGQLQAELALLLADVAGR